MTNTQTTPKLQQILYAQTLPIEGCDPCQEMEGDIGFPESTLKSADAELIHQYLGSF